MIDATATRSVLRRTLTALLRTSAIQPPDRARTAQRSPSCSHRRLMASS
jgi:hypothetical protein